MPRLLKTEISSSAASSGNTEPRPKTKKRLLGCTTKIFISRILPHVQMRTNTENKMSDFNTYAENADPETIDLLRSQWNGAVEQRVIICPCGLRRALEKAYRCLYCGIWFCFSCGEKHFGETLQDRIKKRQI